MAVIKGDTRRLDYSAHNRLLYTYFPLVPILPPKTSTRSPCTPFFPILHPKSHYISSCSLSPYLSPIVVTAHPYTPLYSLVFPNIPRNIQVLIRPNSKVIIKFLQVRLDPPPYCLLVNWEWRNRQENGYCCNGVCRDYYPES